MTAFALLFTLAAIGIAETAYLIRKRRAAEAPICPVGGGCVTVLSSQYNRTFGIHNDFLGMAFYLAMAFLTGFIVVGVGPLPVWDALAGMMIAGALAMSAYLVFLQWRIIKAWCFWCLMSSATVLGMFLILARFHYLLIAD